MKRSTARWTTAMAAAALIGLPATGFAQSTPQTPPSQTSPTTSSPTSSAGQTSASATSAADHVREAKQALAAVPATSIPAESRSKLAQLKTHLNNLDRLVASGGQTATSGSSSKGASSKKGASSWGTEAAAVDKLVSELTAASTDDTAKQKLMDVRRHITELAGSMSGTGTGQDQASAASSSPSSDTMGATPSASQQSTPSAAAASPTPSSTDPTATAAAQNPPSSTTSPSTPTSQSTPTQTNPSEPGTTPSTAPQAGSQGQVDTQAAKQHLSEARESLAQLTSLPEASKLQGDARTQVSQLISNFNELITTQNDWKAAYGKVTSNLDTLLGPDSASAPTATGTSGTTAAPTATAGTTGAAGAGGPAMQIEPAIKAKLQEFRTHLKEFEQAAGGVNGPGAASTSGAMAPSANPSSTANPSNPSATSATSPSPAGASPTTAAPEPTNSPMPTGTSGTSGTSGVAGTSGTATPSATDTQSKAAASGHSDADKHLDAIQNILNSSKDGKLDKDQTDQIKMHLEQLRQLIAQAK